jgi:hypothetical protein
MGIFTPQVSCTLSAALSSEGLVGKSAAELAAQIAINSRPTSALIRSSPAAI